MKEKKESKVMGLFHTNFATTCESQMHSVSCSDRLARIFHTDRNEEIAKADGVRQTSILMPGCMCTYCPNQNVSLTQHPSGFPASAVD
jgi:hypothetical protein